MLRVQGSLSSLGKWKYYPVLWIRIRIPLDVLDQDPDPDLDPGARKLTEIYI
jgi:hypothetical protein